MTSDRDELPGGFPSLFEDLTDTREPDDREEERRKVQEQVASIIRRRGDAQARSAFLSLLVSRRVGREDLVQFDAVRQPEGFEILVASGELLIRRDSYDDAVAGTLRDRGFEEVDADCLSEHIVRLRNRQLSGEALDELGRELRWQGYPLSVDHISPLGPVAKGDGGPEPSKYLRELPGDGGSSSDRAPVVAVIDTGITEQLRDDRWLTDIARDGNIDELDLLPGTGDGKLDFGAGHGTFAAGVVQQVAPTAQIRVYRALDTDGLGSETSVGCAMVQAVRDGATILNLSLGTECVDDYPPVGLQAALEIIGGIERQQGREVLIVAAAGNFGDTRPCFPAAFRRVVAVAGLSAQLLPTRWSSRGFWVTCSCVGEGVVSTYVRGQEAPEIDPNPDSFPDNSWAFWTGTSFAAPQVVGALARICEESGRGPRDALRVLLADRRRIPNFGRVVPILPGT